jgi:uncharacterized protein YndB with AHSA1/START domain
MAESEFVYVTYIRTTPEKLWQALTDPAITRQWWCATVQECAWKPGASWKLMVPDGRVGDEGEVVEIDPPRKLVVTWRNHLFAEMTAEGYSRMSYELEPTGDTVKLTLIHSIERKDSKLIKGVSTGWPALLSSLKSLLETGEPLEATRKWPKEI